MIIRHPHSHDIAAILALFEDEVRAGKMLPRSAENIRASLQDWLVAEMDGRVVGCVSLVTFNPTLCEVRSLAVDPSARGHGLGTQLVEAAIDLAHSRDIDNVLTLTRAAHLFEQIGFKRDVVTNFPEKVWADCAPCPFKKNCDEVALVYVNNGHRK